jgi:hypothetical protein
LGRWERMPQRLKTLPSRKGCLALEMFPEALL